MRTSKNRRHWGHKTGSVSMSRRSRTYALCLPCLQNYVDRCVPRSHARYGICHFASSKHRHVSNTQRIHPHSGPRHMLCPTSWLRPTSDLDCRIGAVYLSCRTRLHDVSVHVVGEPASYQGRKHHAVRFCSCGATHDAARSKTHLSHADDHIDSPSKYARDKISVVTGAWRTSPISQKPFDTRHHPLPQRLHVVGWKALLGQTE